MNSLVKSLNRFFQNKVDVSRVRMGKRQEIETLINEEALLFAMFLRSERQTWKPRIAEP
jgi:hypothetical protein